MSDMRHCWHAQGVSRTHLGGGSTLHQCCHCAEGRHIEWRTVESTIPGHGFYAKQTATVYDWPDDECWARDPGKIAARNAEARELFAAHGVTVSPDWTAAAVSERSEAP